MKKNLALAAIALVLLLGAAQAQSPNSVPGQLKEIQAQLSNLEAQVAANGPRKFYLTKTTHKGDTALTACAMGYHMASQWEILDPTNLRYNTELGVTQDDSGSGPPTSVGGWIRTGFISAPTNQAGIGNCNAWTSASAAVDGTFTGLPLTWNFNSQTVTPWVPLAFSCSVSAPVWCVQD